MTDSDLRPRGRRHAITATLLCAMILVVTSWCLPDPLTPEKQALVWHSLWEPLRDKGWPGLGDYRILSAVLIIVMVALFWFFS